MEKKTQDQLVIDALHDYIRATDLMLPLIAGYDIEVPRELVLTRVVKMMEIRAKARAQAISAGFLWPEGV
jgi:hypothetical protein